MLEEYETLKAFYMVRRDGSVDKKARFPFNLRLEEFITCQGILCTSPCWSAGHGRPNNVDEFCDWAEQAMATPSAAMDMINALTADDLTRAQRQITKFDRRFADHRLVCIRPSKLRYDDPSATLNWRTHYKLGEAESNDGTDVGAAELEQVVPTQPPRHPVGSEHGIEAALTDAEILASPNSVDPWHWLCAAVRAAFRRHGAATGDGRRKILAEAVHLYETCGPATGHSQPEHDERLERAERILDHLEQTFDPARTGTASSSTNSRRRPAARTSAYATPEEIWQRDLTPIIDSAEDVLRTICELEECATAHKYLTLRKLAIIMVGVIAAIPTAGRSKERNAVPAKHLYRFVRAHGGSGKVESVVGRACKLMVAKGILVLVRTHARPPVDAHDDSASGSPGRCRMYRGGPLLDHLVKRHDSAFTRWVRRSLMPDDWALQEPPRNSHANSTQGDAWRLSEWRRGYDWARTHIRAGDISTATGSAGRVGHAPPRQSYCSHAVILRLLMMR